ncbi:MAG: hypothetical protein IKM32_01755 [Clostridia bacterium]|nr:hypothetical protein [Clostridia bacterium]MBR6783394.1 hypothetical protein [Clostridia bacterium]
MSDCIYKIIPESPNGDISANADKAIAYLKRKTKPEDITFTDHGKTAFIDCGENLASISCPLCDAELSFDWWGNAMNEAFENGFSELSRTLPCCNRECSLNDLKYDFPCGFAKNEITLTNPKKEPTDKIIAKAETILKEKIKIIICRY